VDSLEAVVILPDDSEAIVFVEKFVGIWAPRYIGVRVEVVVKYRWG
jgi:hypothetical protein